MDEVKAPAQLEEVIPTAIPADSADLKRIVHTIRLRILYDTGMELERLQLPLRKIDIAFNNLDRNQCLEPVQREEYLRDMLNIATSLF